MNASNTHIACALTRHAARLTGALLLIGAGLTGCQRGPLQPTARLQPATAQPVTSAQPADPRVEAEIAPYRQRVRQQMEVVLGHAPEAIRKNPGESPLANFTADLLRERAAVALGQPIDLSVMTNGGLRAELPAGNITVGSVFELMPFENELVVLEASGAVVQRLFDYAAPIHMAVAGATYTVAADGKPTDIRLGKQRFDPEQDRLYTIAISDYLANGGDNLTFFRPVPQHHTGVLVRNAIEDHLKALTRQGLPVEAKVEGRVKIN